MSSTSMQLTGMLPSSRFDRFGFSWEPQFGLLIATLYTGCPEYSLRFLRIYISYICLTRNKRVYYTRDKRIVNYSALKLRPWILYILSFILSKSKTLTEEMWVYSKVSASLNYSTTIAAGSPWWSSEDWRIKILHWSKSKWRSIIMIYYN